MGLLDKVIQQATNKIEDSINKFGDAIDNVFDDKKSGNKNNKEEKKEINIEQMLRKHFSKFNNKPFYYGNSIPTNKKLGAKSSYAYPFVDGENIMFLYDSTFFGGAKEGMCLTNYGIYIKFSEGATPLKIMYSEITDIFIDYIESNKYLCVNNWSIWQYDEDREDFDFACALKNFFEAISKNKLLEIANEQKEKEANFSELNIKIQNNPKDRGSLMARGIEYFDMEKYGQARADFKEIVRILENEPECWEPAKDGDIIEDDIHMNYEFIGHTYKSEYMYEEAIVSYSKAIEIEAKTGINYDNTDKSGVWLHRGYCYWYQGDKQKAEKDFTRAIDLEPELYETIKDFKNNYQLGERKYIGNADTQITDRRIIVVIGDGDTPKISDFPHYTISEAKKLFKFPPNHPIIDTAYAMAEVLPNSYITVSSFHEYLKQTKHTEFIKLCASLGAKEIQLESVEINERKLDIKSDVASIKSAGLGIGITQNKETGANIAYKFPYSNRGIKEFDSPWLHTEPTWNTMNELRRNSGLLQVGAEFTYLEEMGINAELSAKFLKFGIEIGGNFQELTKIRLVYNVIFWDEDEITIQNELPQKEEQIVNNEYIEQKVKVLPSTSIICKNCNIELSENAKFCNECGTKVNTEIFCSNCETKLSPTSKFCNECGTKT